MISGHRGGVGAGSMLLVFTEVITVYRGPFVLIGTVNLAYNYD